MTKWGIYGWVWKGWIPIVRGGVCWTGGGVIRQHLYQGETCTWAVQEGITVVRKKGGGREMFWDRTYIIPQGGKNQGWDSSMPVICKAAYVVKKNSKEETRHCLGKPKNRNIKIRATNWRKGHCRHMYIETSRYPTMHYPTMTVIKYLGMLMERPSPL